MINVNPTTIQIAKAFEYLSSKRAFVRKDIDLDVELSIDGVVYDSILKIEPSSETVSSIYLRLKNYNGENHIFSLYAVNADTTQTNICISTNESLDVALSHRNSCKHYEKCGYPIISDVDFLSLDEGIYFQYSTVYDFAPWYGLSTFKAYTNAMCVAVPFTVDYFCEMKFTEPCIMTEKEVQINLTTFELLEIFESKILGFDRELFCSFFK